MRTLFATMLAAAAVALLGCVPSLQPLYTPDQVDFDPGLVGEWVTEDGDETWIFTKEDDDAYGLVYTDSEAKDGCFVVHRTEADGVAFIDLYPREPELDAACLYKFLLVPVHTFLTVERDDDHLTLAIADAEWLEDHLEDHPEALAHERVNDGFLVTAQTEDLRAFYSERAKAGEGFGDSMKLTRREVSEADREAPEEAP